MRNTISHSLVATLLLCHAAWAGTVAMSAPASAPGGVYPLKRGIYVAEGSQCDAPANAAIRLYTGDGIDTAHTRACHAVVRGRDHGAYVVDQSCIDAGAGPGPRFSERQRIVVRNASIFVEGSGADVTVYHYCPPAQLPADLRGAVR